MKPKIAIKRAYDEASEDDGYRVLVDRIWPRGLSKAVLHVNEWAKDIAPTTALRTWYGHQPEKWEAFQKKYLAELKDNPSVDEFVKTHKKYPLITLVFGAKDEAHANAVVLKEFLEKKYSRD